MAIIEPNLVPDEYYSAKDIDRLFAALEKRMQAREVLRIEHVMDLLEISRAQVDRMCKDGQLPFHKLEGLGTKLFLRSELIGRIKNS